jgi:hypothetical protein
MRQPEHTDQTWQAIQQQLQRQRDTIIDEIRQYPAPIPACDVQFNHLLAQRDAILRECRLLARIDPLDSERLRAFIANSAFIAAFV